MQRHTIRLPSVRDMPKVPLTYLEKPLLCTKQARHRGRLVLTPEINIGDYECRAVIDWLVAPPTARFARDFVSFSFRVGKSSVGCLLQVGS